MINSFPMETRVEACILMTLQHDTLDEIFTKALRAPTIFQTYDALRSDYVPNNLPFRHQEVASIAQVLAPILHSSKPSNLLLYGKTGTGKTAVTKHVINKLNDMCASSHVPAKFIYTNVRTTGTEYRILAELATGIGLTIPFTGLAISEVLSRVQLHIRTHHLQTIFILDEIDYLAKSLGDDILYQLTNSSPNVAPGFLSLVGISNDLQFKESLGARVISRLSEEEIVFPPYSAVELKTILQERATLAFNAGKFSEAAVNLCAALSGSEHGDARRAVDLLRIAGEVAERDGAGQLEERHVRIALQKIDQDRVGEALRTLPLQAKLILIAVVKNSATDKTRPSSGSIYDEYTRLCKLSGLEALTTRRVSGLISELDTLGLVSTNIVNYGRYGRTKKVVPHVSISLLHQAFGHDESITQLL
jgi:cell division control protein 6